MTDALFIIGVLGGGAVTTTVLIMYAVLWFLYPEKKKEG
jgi:phage shock protein PspC (stress-responsive transcriptional regulator)